MKFPSLFSSLILFSMRFYEELIRIVEGFSCLDAFDGMSRPMRETVFIALTSTGQKVTSN